MFENTNTHTHSLLPRFVSVSLSLAQSVSLSAWPAAWPAVYLCLSLSVCLSGEQTLIFLQPNILVSLCRPFVSGSLAHPTHTT